MNSATAPTDLQDVFHTDILPALPQSALAIVQLSQQTENGSQEFVKAIEADPGLMGQVLKFANSEEFEFSGQIMSVHDALVRVGTRAICNFAMWNAVFSLTPNPKFGPYELKALWQDSLRRAVFARAIARSMNLDDAEDLFAGALLQDMAIPLLLRELPKQYEELVARRAAEGRRLSGLEYEMFGWDHADAAAMLAKRWHLPDRFVDLVGQHTRMDGIVDGGAETHGNMCVALASLLPSCRDGDWDDEEREQFIDGYERLTRKPFESLRDLFVQVDRESNEFAPLLRLPPPQRELADYIAVAADAGE
ncbi:MAG: HDOD domain-containing protein [Pirellulaceae bacterium]|nr:HDOD domain-containing protein [Pirellulaceae bacterium]